MPGKENENLFLSRSPQLYKEIAALKSQVGKVYEIGPVFRGESSNGERRANEFISLDVEIRTNKLSEIIEILSDFILNIRNDVNLIKAMKEITNQLDVPDKIISITYNEAIKILSCKEIKEDQEKQLSKFIRQKNKNTWILLTDFPSKLCGFYKIKDNGLTESFDLINNWEICSGGLRRRDIAKYFSLLRKQGWSTKEFGPYVNIIQAHKMQNTCGFGIGIERLIGAIINNNINNLQIYPRTRIKKYIFK